MKRVASLLSEVPPMQGGTERYSNLCQLVFHPGRNLGINCAQYNTIALKLSQLLNKHLLRDCTDGSLRLRETHDSAFLVDSPKKMAEE
jgi:hypothetical protein